MYISGYLQSGLDDLDNWYMKLEDPVEPILVLIYKFRRLLYIVSLVKIRLLYESGYYSGIGKRLNWNGISLTIITRQFSVHTEPTASSMIRDPGLNMYPALPSICSTIE